MRSITVTMWVTLDGVVQGLGRADEDTRGSFAHGGWGPRYDDEVMGREMAKAMTRPGDMLLGRRTWQDFTAVWGRRTDDNPVTTRMNATTKYVVSTTLEDANGELVVNDGNHAAPPCSGWDAASSRPFFTSMTNGPGQPSARPMPGTLRARREFCGSYRMEQRFQPQS